MASDIRESHLDNGLMVLLAPVHNAPVATFWIWYRVGSRNEVPGITGISHWCEHMMFKGTPTLGKGEIMHLINRNGGVDNAFTSLDFTTYFESLPSDRIDLAIKIESDRMVNTLFDPEEVASERTVIISEREGGENEPRYLLSEDVQATAFKIHPYHHDTIGWKVDLETMTRDDLYRHYKKYYAPNNAIIVVAGDFEADEMLAKIADAFGKILRNDDIPLVKSVEPPQEGERRVRLMRPGPTAFFHVMYHAPKASDADFFPTFVLASILSGVGGMSFSGGGSPGRSSRLYRALVEKGLAVDVDCGFRAMLDPSTIDITSTVTPGGSIEKVERAIFDELEKIASKPVTDTELAKVIKQAKSQFVYATDGVMNLGYWLGQWEIVASYKMYDAFIDNLEQVTKADVTRVAAKYLTETNRTVGWFVPTNGNGKTAKRALRKGRRQSK
jgi:zinc protease